MPNSWISALLIAPTLAFAACFSASAQWPDASTAPTAGASLAGTFNNWDPADPSYELAPVSSHEELVRLWPAGRYEFKFAFGGSWDSHWGQSDDGALVQPGRNISLEITEPGAYAIWLDRPARRWGLERRPADDNKVTVDNDMKTARRTRVSFKTPDWAKTAVWYQIFPERFRNGDPANDPPSAVPWRHAWFKPYKPSQGKRDGSMAQKTGYTDRGKFYDYIFNRRYGGDIQGIREKLPYLRDLGVSAIYLNPIFQAESLHKYDTADYRHVDDHFGVRDSRLKLREDPTDPSTWKWSQSDLLFLEFLNDAHRMGFKVVLDGVFNHVGRDFFAFQDVLKHGRKSKFAEWIDVKSWEPFHYYGWWGEDNSLPRLKHDEALGLAKPVREHIFAITRRWMDPNGDGDPSDGIDGWRLDVAPDINAHFWRDWRKLVKSINPDAYIVAEIWTRADDALRGDQFDAVMNYEFAKAAQRFFVNRKRLDAPAKPYQNAKATSATDFGRELDAMLSWYPSEVNLVMQNLFDSHDTDRLASMLFNPNLEYDGANRLQDNGPHYNAGRPTADCYKKLKLMVTFQMMFVGSPMIWYGDEAGMFGADDPTCRKPMLWPDLMPYDDPDERIMPDVHAHYRRMIAIRNTYPSLQRGSYRTIFADDRRGLFAFERSLDVESIVIVLNNSDERRRADVPVTWRSGSTVLRVDDPAAFASMEPAQPSGRVTVRPVAGHKSNLHVEDHRLHGLMLEPRSGAVLARQER